MTIEDFGHGLSQKEIDEINEPFGYRWNTGKENRGIGIRYVKAMLSTFYQGNADLFVNSKRGTGTKITIILPAAKEVDEHECFYRISLSVYLLNIFSYVLGYKHFLVAYFSLYYF